jgi:hypothetical protein
MLFETAVSLLRCCRGDVVGDDSNRDACRQQASAGMLVVGHCFSRGRAGILCARTERSLDHRHGCWG